MVLVFLWAYSQHIIKTAVTSTPWFTLPMAPDWRRKTELNVDIVVEVAVAAMEGCFDEGIVVSVRAHLSSVLIGRDAHVQLWAIVRQRGDPEVLTRCDFSRGKFEVFMRTIFFTVFDWPIDTNVMGHVIPVEDPEAQWVCCILCWLFVDLPFGLYFFEGGIGVVGRWRLGLGLAVFSSIAAVSVRADKVVSFWFMHQAGLGLAYEQQPPYMPLGSHNALPNLEPHLPSPRGAVPEAEGVASSWPTEGLPVGADASAGCMATFSAGTGKGV
jgi:hypothetical protein